MTLEDAWQVQEKWAREPHYDVDARCLLDLRARVEALEPRAATEESSATEPAPAPAADRPLWAQMHKAYGLATAAHPTYSARYAAEIDAVADWLARSLPIDPVKLLRAEARRARGKA